jgi:hypothetical protein
MLITLNPFNAPFDLKRMGRTGPSTIPEETGSERVNVAGRFPVNFDSVIKSHEVELIRLSLAAAHYQQREAARLLCLTYDRFRGLYRKYKKRLESEAPAGDQRI